MEHFDEDSDLRVSAKLSAELSTLFKPQLPVPPEVDRAVSDLARKHFVRRESAKLSAENPPKAAGRDSAGSASGGLLPLRPLSFLPSVWTSQGNLS
jgi:hypothetical protein